MQTTSYALITANLTTNAPPHITLGSSLPLIHQSGSNQQTILRTFTGYIRHFVNRRHLEVNQYLRSDWLIDGFEVKKEATDFNKSDHLCKLPRSRINKQDGE